MPIRDRVAATSGVAPAAAAYKKSRRVMTKVSIVFETGASPEFYHCLICPSPLERILDSGDAALFDVRSKARGPQGSLPITPEMLLTRPSGDLFGWSAERGHGLESARLWAARNS